MQILTILMPCPSTAFGPLRENCPHSAQDVGVYLHHRHAAIHAEDLTGDVRGFV